MPVEDVLKFFHSDPTSLEKALAMTDSCCRDRACSLIQSLNRHGIAHSHIDVEDFAVFRHEGIADTIEQFIRDNPFDALPLERITVIQYAARDTCRQDLAEICRRLAAHQERMAHFARRFNIDIHVNLFVQSLDSAQAIAIAAFAGSDAVDSLGFFFDFARIDAESVSALQAGFEHFCDHAVVRNPKIKFGNFPFCFFPAAKFKYLYRDALDGLKGQIGAQRDLLRDLRSRERSYHGPCRECRCRTPCYAYTRILEFPECAPLVVPRRERTLAFAGGSLSPAERPADSDIVWTAPAEQDDMLAAILEGFDNVLIIDGYFYSRFPCTTFEVMLALAEGINVFGSSSIGALRAVELDRYGMVGVGYVYEHLKKKEIKPYHIVAQTYDEEDRPLTVPLVQIVYLLECALMDGAISRDEHEALGALADHVHFTVLSFEYFFRQARADLGLAAAADRLETFYRNKGREHFDVKKKDALLLLSQYRSVLASRPRDRVRQTVREARDRYLGILRGRYTESNDLALPLQWKSPTRTNAGDFSITRDRREVSADKTCDHARLFFEDLDIVVADTTRYDPANSFILSAFFLPFYFFDYYPSSATGNGDVFQEALASAYMELVERVSACTLQIAGRKRGELESEPFPLEQLPQFYNWGAEAAVKQQAVDEHGYASVTDIVTGRSVLIPAFALLFRYSGTDGYASGNSLAEATLYGMYELIERDTCQIHLVDPACRQALPQFQIDKDRITDKRCRTLLAQAEEKGCDIVLFSLPNLFGLPCVMCHVYDRNRRIQCHGGIAVRADFHTAVHAALQEAYMQYITYFVGTRDDYHSFAPTKQAHLAYENARRMFFDGPVTGPPPPEPVRFATVSEELEYVTATLTGAGVGHILVADISPRAGYEVKSVKVIIPTLELWFCPQYRPSPFLAARAEQTVARMGATL